MSINIQVTSNNLRNRADEAARRASQIVMGELFAAFQQSFTAPVWQWTDTITPRGGGGTAGSPRNIIDTGNLRQTGSWQMIGPYQGKFTWSANYATAVHEGAFIFPWGNRNAQRVQLPPRPWTRAVLGQEQVGGIKPYDMGERLTKVWLAKFNGSR